MFVYSWTFYENALVIVEDGFPFIQVFKEEIRGKGLERVICPGALVLELIISLVSKGEARSLDHTLFGVDLCYHEDAPHGVADDEIIFLGVNEHVKPSSV